MKKENLRGQRAITEDDILAIPKIIEEADFIELDREKYDGKPIIRFIKTINGKATVVSYVSQKKHDLGVQTMYSSIKNIALLLRRMPKPSRKRPKLQVIQLSLTPLYHKVIRMSIAVYAQKGKIILNFLSPKLTDMSKILMIFTDTK